MRAPALAAAAYLAKLHNGQPKLVLSAGLHPHSIETVRTYAHGYGMEVVEVPRADGVTDLDAWRAAIDADTSAAMFAQPNFYGAVEDAAELERRREAGRGRRGRSGRRRLSKGGAARARMAGAGPVVISQVDPIALGVLASPGECGVDVAVGEGQSLGNRLDFGGPSFGFFGPARSTCDGCPVGSPARRPTSTAGAASS